MNTVFGSAYAPAYDFVYDQKDYDGEVELLHRLFVEYAEGDVRSVLDLGCGTGSHLLRLASTGYEVVGVDRSSEMLAVAAKKARERNLNVTLHQQDVRQFQLSNRFDAVIMMFAVLGYQTENSDILDTLRAARRHMRAGGLLVFDIWFGPAVLSQKPDERVRRIEGNNEYWIRTASGEIDLLRDVCHVDIRLTHYRVGHEPTEVHERHTMRYFFVNELELLLNVAGFRLARVGAFPNFDSDPGFDTWSIMAVAVVM